MAGRLTRVRGLFTGGARIGTNINYTDLAQNTGYETMAGSARVSKDIAFNAADILVAASSFNSGSMVMATMSGSNLSALKMTNALAGCPMWLSLPIPNDASITGGSGALFIDWTELVTNSACAVFAASVYALVAGSPLSAASTLGAAAGAQFACASSTQIVQSSVLNLTAPTSRNGRILIKFFNDLSTASQSASQIALFGVRYRYVADRQGTQYSGG